MIKLLRDCNVNGGLPAGSLYDGPEQEMLVKIGKAEFVVEHENRVDVEPETEKAEDGAEDEKPSFAKKAKRGRPRKR